MITSYNLVPTHAQDTDEDTKKRDTQLFIRREMDIKMAKTDTILTHKMLLKAFPEEYYMELGDPILGYDRVSPKELIAHILRHYAKIDDDQLLANHRRFEEPPDFTLPLDAYYQNQEECQRLAEDGNVKILQEDMVLQL